MANTTAKPLKCSGHERSTEGAIMLDVVFIAATAVFFAVGIFYVRGCERLK
jgi:hypothetical protein